MSSLVSIVLPAHASNPMYLEESVQSILSQTYSRVELIIVMDPSDPQIDSACFRVIEQLKAGNRLKLIVNERRLGFVRSLNKGLSLAEGEFIGRMDSDDISSSTRIEKEVKWLGERGVDLVGCWTEVINPQGIIVDRLHPPSQWKNVRSFILFHNPFVHSSILFTRKLLETVGPYKLQTSEDYELYLRALSSGLKAENVPEYLHRLREGQASTIRFSHWREDRRTYVQAKVVAVRYYHYRRPQDILFCLMSPLSLLVRPCMMTQVRTITHFMMPSGSRRPSSRLISTRSTS